MYTHPLALIRGVDIWCFATSHPLPEIVSHLVSVAQVVEADGVDRAKGIRVIPSIEIPVRAIWASHQE